MKLVKIVNARQVLDSIPNEEKISTHLAYWIAKFIVKTEDEYVFYVGEMQKLFAAFAVKNEDNTMFVPGEKVADFNAAVAYLNDTDVEDPCIRFSLSDLSAELKLSMKQMYPLLDFIDEDK